MMRSFVLLLVVLIFTGCQNRPAPAPETPDTINVAGNAQALPDRVIDGPIPGCFDAFEVVGQLLTLPGQALTFDVGGVMDRVGIVVTGATYSYSTRPVNSVTCEPTTLPELPLPAISFGFNYLGDFTRVTPLCMNASHTDFTEFSITGTPLDLLMEGVSKDLIWLEVDRSVAGTLHSLLNGGAFPAAADPRCNNWVDLTTL